MNVSPASRARTGEPGVLGEEPIARVDRIGAGGARRRDDGRDVQIAGRCLVRADGHRDVRVAHVARVPIALGVDGDRRQPHLAAGADDADGDLAAVGDEHPHSGMFPCFFGGLRSRLVSRPARAAMSLALVWRG